MAGEIGADERSRDASRLLRTAIQAFEYVCAERRQMIRRNSDHADAFAWAPPR